MKNKAINALIEMGANMSDNGFAYIVDAMVLFEDEEIRTGSVMHLYERIADMHNKTSMAVERCIRNEFGTITKKGNLRAVEKYLTMQNTTNSNLLHVFYFRLSRED